MTDEREEKEEQREEMSMSPFNELKKKKKKRIQFSFVDGPELCFLTFKCFSVKHELKKASERFFLLFDCRENEISIIITLLLLTLFLSFFFFVAFLSLFLTSF